LERVREAVSEAVERGEIPGAVVVIGRHDAVAMRLAIGHRALAPAREPMTLDTIFDLASLTKPLATASSIMILIDEGKLRLSDRLGALLSEFDNHGKGAITLEQLLRHRSGLIADNPIEDYADGSERAWERLANLSLSGTPGARFVYSDVNYMILGRVIEAQSGWKLADFARERVFQALGMTDTGFWSELATRRGSEGLPVERFAPTEKVDNTILRRIVHDPRARALGGAAGHAGLFGTGDDLAVFASMMLGRGKVEGKTERVLSPLAVDAMTDPGETPSGEQRGLGWDISTSYSSPRGELLGPLSFGHTGFTGTSIWIDPATGLFVILLTSRLHPDGKGASPIRLRARVATLAAAALVDPQIRAETRPATSHAPAEPRSRRQAERVKPVSCGIDVLEARGFDVLRGKRVGLVTNPTGRTRDGRSTIDVLRQAPDVELVAIFAPEHGIRAELDRLVADERDEKSGLPIYSLYGESRKPTKEQVAKLDVLVYDIQDIGARFYTYISTLGLVLEAAAESGREVVVLDRPNPIGGDVVAGPVRDADKGSFIAYHELPVRHGMTVGELARMYNAERSIGARLTVIPCEGWQRSMRFDETGLVWVNPSPNMRSLTQAMLYPGVGLLEATNLATGRGTDTPFERVGAPWIEPGKFANALRELQVEGVRFVPIHFVPSERQYQGEVCGGVNLVITNWERFNPLELGVGLAVVLRKLYPDAWDSSGLLRMTADRPTFEAVREGKSLAAIRGEWSEELDRFLRVRSKYLMYD
jgi:uncharacterized protein YbbC (DUF1343 family)/CubicO group peptidase (beta-lactamase class C family)